MLWDYAAIELRILGYYAAVTPGVDDPTIAEQIKAGIDPHLEAAKMLFNTEEPTKEERQFSKRRNFSLLYGGGTKTLMAQGIAKDFKHGKVLVEQFHEAFPAVRKLEARINRRLDERGYITTLWGRHLHPQDRHKACNALIQGCAADLIRDAMRKVGRWYKENPELRSHMVSVVHDELILDAPLEEMALLRANIPRLMDNERISAVCPIETEHEYSTTNWAAKQTYEEVEVAA